MRIWGVGLVVLMACGDSAGFVGDRDSGGFADAGTNEDGGVPDAGPPEPLYPGSPPALQGGTLLVTRDGAFVVAADPDRDRVWIMEWATQEVRAIVLPLDAEPGRMVEDTLGRVHLVLRRGGAVATIDPMGARLVSTMDVCAAPSGIAYRVADDRLLVACAHGELVRLTRDGVIEDRMDLADDLRDVVVQGDRVFVSTFRSADVLVLERDVLTSIHRPVAVTVRGPDGMGVDLSPHVAWRLVPTEGGVFALHQRASNSAIDVDIPGAYGGGGMECQSGITHGSVTRFDGTDSVQAGPSLGSMALPVDFAISPDGSQFAVANGAWVMSPGEPQVSVHPLGALSRASPADCVPRSRGVDFHEPSQAAAVAFHPSGALVVQYREPGLLRIENAPGEAGASVRLPDAGSVYDGGHALFHQQTASGTACASCHPGGHEDGHTWELGTSGPRRTQTLLGGLLDTAPFHWSGDQPTLETIMRVTFSERMVGGRLFPEQVDQIGAWLDAQPAPPALPADTRGAEVFATSGCVDCHGGATPSMASIDVGTGAAFQAPRLSGVAYRAPYFHDGCAATLEATLDGSCTAGHAVSLPDADRDALIRHLRAL